MPAYFVERSIVVEKTPQEVMDFLSDFNHWRAWSPWLIMEPSCHVDVYGQQGEPEAGYHWQGDLVGEGKMELIRKSVQSLDIDLEFIKPFKSSARADFRAEPHEQGTKLTWLLHAKLPFYLFFLKKTLEMSLGMDYERGLKMLKSLLETGKVPSKVSLIGRRKAQLQYYVALEHSLTIEQLSQQIPEDYKKLEDLFKTQHIQPTGAPLTVYFEMNMTNRVCRIHNAFPVEQAVSVPAPFVCAALPEHDTFSVKHTGAYPFVGNAWAYAMFIARAQKVKLRKSPVGYEHYIGDPQTTKPDALETDIVLFTK